MPVKRRLIYDASRSGLWTRGLLVRRKIADGDMTFFSTWCSAGTPIETLVKVEGHRWAIEDSFETAKNEFGLDHNETRSWHGWHRHVSLVMLAFATLAVIRHRTNSAAPPKMDPPKPCGDGVAPSDPLVDSGSPPPRHPNGPAANTTRPYHGMVNMETRPSGHRAASASQIKNATVTLGRPHAAG
jgi:hypothetical protein